MGSIFSSLTQEDIEELKHPDICNFTTRELSSLYQRFRYLDRSKDGYITEEEFHLIPELSMNPLADRIIQLLFTREKRCNFKTFVQSLWPFSPRCPLVRKQRLAFELYDFDGDGLVGLDDLFHTLQMMTGSNLAREELWEIAARAFQECGFNEEDRIGFDEFKELDFARNKVALMNCIFD